MWNWLVSALASGATVVLYDGSPFVPGPDHLFDIVDEEGISLLGVSAKFIDALAKAGLQPSTARTAWGACARSAPPVRRSSPEGFRYVYEQVKDDVHLASISGGTDLCGCLVGGDPTGPVYAGEIQRPALGMAIDVWSRRGRIRWRPARRRGAGLHRARSRRCRSASGTTGPSAPRDRVPGRLLRALPGGVVPRRLRLVDRARRHRDPRSQRRHAQPGRRPHRDSRHLPRRRAASRTWSRRSSSDSSGKATSASCWSCGCSPVINLDDSLVADLRTVIRRELSPRHVPAVIVAVDDLPRTRSGKLVELAVADAVNGRPVRNREAIANPEAIDAIAAVEALQS